MEILVWDYFCIGNHDKKDDNGKNASHVRGIFAAFDHDGFLGMCGKDATRDSRD